MRNPGCFRQKRQKPLLKGGAPAPENIRFGERIDRFWHQDFADGQ
jgi:hypothetical protein